MRALLTSSARDGLGAADPVDVEPAVALEVRQGAGRRRAEDPVDAAAVEPEPAERGLQLADVVAAQVRGDESQRAVTEPPRGLDEREPRRFVALAVVAQPAMALEGADGVHRGRVEQPGSSSAGETGGAEAALQVADGVAVLTGGQREETRNSSSSWSSWDLPLAPTRRLCTSPPEKTSSVGMLITL